MCCYRPLSGPFGLALLISSVCSLRARTRKVESATLVTVNYVLALFDCATAPGRQYAEPVSTSETADENLSAPSTGSFLRNSGWFARILKYNVNAWLHVRVFTVDYMYMNHCSVALC